MACLPLPPQVSDFGLARVTGGGVHKTQTYGTGEAPGLSSALRFSLASHAGGLPSPKPTTKPRTSHAVTHQPPELLSEGLLSTAADVWACGVLLFELAQGRLAWKGMRPSQVLGVTVPNTCAKRALLQAGCSPALARTGTPTEVIVQG